MTAVCLSADIVQLLQQTIAALPAATERLLQLLREQHQPCHRCRAASGGRRTQRQATAARSVPADMLNSVELPNGLRIVCGSPIEARSVLKPAYDGQLMPIQEVLVFLAVGPQHDQ